MGEGKNSKSDDNVKEFDSLSRWSVCRLSNKPLRAPVVSDCKGNLLNKEAVLEWLLTPEREDYLPQQIKMFEHIKSLKDVVELGNLVEVEGNGNLKCEVGDEVLGKSSAKLVYLANCGHVLPYKLLKQTVIGNKCPVCESLFDNSNLVTLNPSTEADRKALEVRARELKSKGIAHNGRRLNPRKKRKILDSDRYKVGSKRSK